MKFFALSLAACIIAVNSNFVPVTDDGEIAYIENLNSDVTRRNEVVIASYAGMSEATAVVGKESLEALVSTNANNGQILDDMYTLFSGLNRAFAWHITFQSTSYGYTPTAYVYYLFDRNNTELLVAGYKRCA